MRQLCAFVYVLLLDKLDQRYQAQVLAATIAAAVGADVNIPDESEVREQFEQLLRQAPGNSDAAAADPDREILRQALGLS